ncbi:MAG: hypothetical protein B7Y90_05760 [Alphaproteobacteria bacterium 32-64-14]|nr:MAG: hypothetical protein B7Y90_05760 [Alphaproteobacteria bacterium 32-64-14]
MRIIIAAAAATLCVATAGCEGLDSPEFTALLDQMVADANASTPAGIAARAWSSPADAGFVWKEGQWELKDKVYVWRQGAWDAETPAAKEMVNAVPQGLWQQAADGWHFAVPPAAT